MKYCRYKKPPVCQNRNLKKYKQNFVRVPVDDLFYYEYYKILAFASSNRCIACELKAEKPHG